MKAHIRKVVRKVAGWPVVGRFFRIGVAVIRLPEFRAEYLARNVQGGADNSPTSQLLANLDHRGLFESQQLPTLLQALADINHRQLASDNDRDNLVKSAPVALRTMARDIKALQDALGSMQGRFDTGLDKVRGELEAATQAGNGRFDQLGERLAQTDTRLNDADTRLKDADTRLSQADTRLGEADTRMAALANQADGLANTLDRSGAETRGDIATIKESVTYLLGRVEFVRRELMFEMRYGASAPGGGDEALQADTAIVATDKVEAARRDGLRLNLGCGHVPLDGYLNVDRRALPGVDIVAEVDQLPFAAAEVQEIFSAHLLEHFPQEQLRRKLLPYYFGLIRSGGQFHAVVPDAEAMMREYARGEYPYDSMREVLYGGQDYDGDFHFNMFTPASLSELLIEAGFVNPRIIAAGRKNGQCYEFEIAADKQ
jgi:hypothetical protein